MENENFKLMENVDFQPQKFNLAYAGILIAGILILLSMYYGFYLGSYMMDKYVPLVNASSKIRVEATMAHLWLEEIVSGDKNDGIETVRNHIKKARWFANAMLNGGRDFSNEIIPLKSPFLRKEVGHILKEIDDFSKITEFRYKNYKTSGIGSDIDQKYDRIFKNFVNAAEKVETNLISEINYKKKVFKANKILLLVLNLLLLIFIFYLIKSCSRRSFADFMNLKNTNEKLSKALSEIKTLQGIIPICSYCKKIRDKKGLWNSIEKYIYEHSNAEFSHGVCPDCYEKQKDMFKRK